MQRKNSLLKGHRRGIAMIMAIMVIVILATIMSLTLNMTATTTKQTVNDYLHEQAILLTRSATEYALLRISGLNRNGINCLTSLRGTHNGIYDIDISWQYIGLSNEGSDKDPSGECSVAQSYIRNGDVDDMNSKGSILLDVVVSVNDKNVTTEPIRYHRRTLQKL